MARKTETKPLVIAETKPKKVAKTASKNRKKHAAKPVIKPVEVVASKTLAEVIESARRKGSNAFMRKRAVNNAIKRFNNK